MPIAARSAPNNGRVKEAKVSSCTRSTGKALNGKAKRGTNRQANGDEKGDEKGEVRQAKRKNRYKVKRGNRYKVKRGDKRKNSDDDIKESRGADKSGNVRGNGEGERRDWEVQSDQ